MGKERRPLLHLAPHHQSARASDGQEQAVLPGGSAASRELEELDLARMQRLKCQDPTSNSSGTATKISKGQSHATTAHHNY